MLIVVQFTVCHLRTCLAYACKAVITERTTTKSSACARGLNLTGSRGNFGAYDLKATGHRERSARVRFWKLLRTLSELGLLSCVEIVHQHFVELFPQVYRGTGTLLFNVGHLL